MAATELKFSGSSATTAGFPLKGGRYTAVVVATFGGGSVTLHVYPIGPGQHCSASYF
jgi:hypothetical protein